jgi:hypothetical protein
MPKVKPGQSRKGKNKVPKITTQRGQSSSTGLSAEAEQALIDKIANSVVDKLIKGGPSTELLSVHVLPKHTLVYDTHVQNVPLCAC